jgi:HEAT repeat protein
MSKTAPDDELRGLGASLPLADIDRAIEDLASPDLAVHYRAQRFFLGLGPGALPLLSTLLEADIWGAREEAAVEIMKHLGEPAAVPLLLAALQSPRSAKRLCALRGLRWLLRDPEPFLAALADDDWQVRQEALFALGGLPLAPEAVARIVLALEDPHYMVRAAAANALGRLHCSGAAEALQRTLKDENRRVKDMAAWSLKRLADPSAMEPLLTALAADAAPTATTRADALHRAAARPEGMPCPALMALLNDPDESIRAEVMELLGRQRCREAVEALALAVRFEPPALKRTAAMALAGIGTPAVPALRRLLDETDETVRGQSVAALGQIMIRTAAESVLKAMSEESDVVREEARRALSRLGRG